MGKPQGYSIAYQGSLAGEPRLRMLIGRFTIRLSQIELIYTQ